MWLYPTGLFTDIKIWILHSLILVFQKEFWKFGWGSYERRDSYQFHYNHICIMPSWIPKSLNHLTQNKMLHMVEGQKNTQVKSMVTGIRLLDTNPSVITKKLVKRTSAFSMLKCFTFCNVKPGCLNIYLYKNCCVIYKMPKIMQICTNIHTLTYIDN